MSRHFHPESWAVIREDESQALTGARAGGAIEHRKGYRSGCRGFRLTEGSIQSTDMARGTGIPRCLGTQARTHCTGTWEVSMASRGRSGSAKERSNP